MTNTKPMDVTQRCQNCGGLRKEHGKLKPFKCPTRLTKSDWKPWTVEEYDAAVVEGERVVKESKDTPKETVTLDFYSGPAVCNRAGCANPATRRIWWSNGTQWFYCDAHIHHALSVYNRNNVIQDNAK